MKAKIKATYKLSDSGKTENQDINSAYDKLIAEKIASIGGEWYAQGVSTSDGIRDICFDLKLE